MTKRQLQMFLKKHKVRDCNVKINRLKIQGDDAYRKALFRMHNIRDLKVVLDRVVINKPSTSEPKKKLLPKNKKSSVRSNVIWLSKNPLPVKKTVNFARTLERHVVPSTSNLASPEIANSQSKINPGKRRRANSLFAERPVMETPKPPLTMDDLHAELMEKRASLKPASERQLGPRLNIQSVPQWKRIYKEFQQKMVSKMAK